MHENPFQQRIAEFVVAQAGVTLEQALETIAAAPHASGATYAVPVPRLNRYARLKSKPADVAMQWAEAFEGDDLLSKAVADKTYVNFFVVPAAFQKWVLTGLHTKGDTWRVQMVDEKRTVAVEYSSPNIAKPFHAGHLRSTIIGNFLANVLEYVGNDVHRINYLGDWGKQYGLLALGYQKYGKEESLEQDPIKHLFEVYVAINKDAAEDDSVHDAARKYFIQMEEGDEKVLALWRKFRELSVEEYKKLYARLNVHYDEYSGESFYTEGMKRAYAILEEKDMMFEDRGAMLINLNDAKLGKVLVRKNDGGTLYITRDIAAAMDRYERLKFHRMYYVVAAAQDLHFKQLFTILKRMGFEWADRLEHVNFGMVLGMSTRKGNVAFLADIMDDTQAVMRERMNQHEEKAALVEDADATSNTVGLSALVVQDFSARRIKNYKWDLVRSTLPEGDTGPFLQYTHARLASIERKVGLEVTADVDFSLLSEESLLTLAIRLSNWPQIVAESIHGSDPCKVTSYLISLCHAISNAVNTIYVLGREEELAKARILPYACARMVLNRGIRLIGLVPLDRL